jgi:hypothetical protein
MTAIPLTCQRINRKRLDEEKEIQEIQSQPGQIEGYNQDYQYKT